MWATQGNDNFSGHKCRPPERNVADLHTAPREGGAGCRPSSRGKTPAPGPTARASGSAEGCGHSDTPARAPLPGASSPARSPEALGPHATDPTSHWPCDHGQVTDLPGLSGVLHRVSCDDATVTISHTHDTGRGNGH